MHNYLKLAMIEYTALSPEYVFDPQLKETVPLWFGLAIWKTKCVWKGDFFACESVNWTWTSHEGFAVEGTAFPPSPLHSHSDHCIPTQTTATDWELCWPADQSPDPYSTGIFKNKASQPFYPGKIRHVSMSGVYYLSPALQGPCHMLILSMWSCAL